MQYVADAPYCDCVHKPGRAKLIQKAYSWLFAMLRVTLSEFVAEGADKRAEIFAGQISDLASQKSRVGTTREV